MNFQHACQGIQKDTSIFSHHYTWICIIRFIRIIKRFISSSFWTWTNCTRTGQSGLPTDNSNSSSQSNHGPRCTKWKLKSNQHIQGKSNYSSVSPTTVQPVQLQFSQSNYKSGQTLQMLPWTETHWRYIKTRIYK